VTETEVIVRRIASHGLRHLDESMTAPEVSDLLWPSVLRSVAKQRITGLASAAARERALLLTESQRDELLDRHRSAMAMVLLLEDLLRKVSSAMTIADVPIVVLKGPAVAQAFYPHPSWRSYGDLDLLIAGADWRRACRVLAGLGFRRLIPEPRRGFDERFGKGASFENSQALQVDLHRTLALGPFGLWIEPQALRNATTEFRWDDLSLRRLDDTHALIHACIHAALGRQVPLLVPLRDVAQIAWSGGIDWGLLSQRTVAWRLAAPVSYAMRTAVDTLDVRLPEETEQLLGIRIPRIERRSLQAYTTDRTRRGGPALAALWAIPGLRARVVYIRAMLFPEDRFRAARQQGSGGRGSRLMIPLRWAVDRIRGGRKS
jgi:hypothetical protein